MKYRFRKHPSKLAALMVTFGAGNRVEFQTQYPEGIAHYMEHVRFKGTDENSAKDLLRKAADAGGSWNAWTSEDLVSYHMSIPEENLEAAFQCLSDIILRPAFPEEELEKEKDVVCQEIRLYDDEISELVHKKAMNSIFENAMIKPILGTKDSVQSITRQNILDFDKEFYSPEHRLVMLAANHDRTDLVEKYFGKQDDVLLFKPPPNVVNYKPAVSCKVYKEAQLQNYISMSFGSPDIHQLSKNSRAEIKVFSKIFGQGDTSRLFLKVREDLGLVYGISSVMQDHMDGTFYCIVSYTEPKNSEKVISTVEEEIALMIDQGPTEIELKRAKNIIKSSYYKSMDSSYGAINEMLHEEFYDYKTGSEFLAEIESVTVEDVQAVANNIFTGTKYLVVGTGEKDGE